MRHLELIEKLIEQQGATHQGHRRDLMVIIRPVGEPCNTLTIGHVAVEPPMIDLAVKDSIREAGELDVSDANKYRVKIDGLKLHSKCCTVQIEVTEGFVNGKDNRSGSYDE